MRVEEIGNSVLILGDCRGVLPLIEPGLIDAVLTDPPYGVKLKNHGHPSKHPRSGAKDLTVLGDEDQTAGIEVIEWANGLELPLLAFASPFKPWPGDWRNLIAWDKGGAVGGGGDTATCLKKSWELIQVARNGRMAEGRMESVWRFPIAPSNMKDHVCRKPVPLLVQLLDVLFPEAQVIFDPFMGSGSTGEACVVTKKVFLGIEANEKHFDTACRNISAAWDSTVR